MNKFQQLCTITKNSNVVMKQNMTNMIKICYLKFNKIIITQIILFLLLYIFLKLEKKCNTKLESNDNSDDKMPNYAKIQNDSTLNTEAYYQMSFGQKIIYLRRLLGYYLLYDNYEKRKIDRQIFSYLSTERRLLKKQNNEQLLSRLGDRFQSAIDDIQNPFDCYKARILVCPIDAPNWGFGFVTHQIRICLLYALESRRTMVIKNLKRFYKYSVKWFNLFDSTSNCSYAKHVNVLNNHCNILVAPALQIFFRKRIHKRQFLIRTRPSKSIIFVFNCFVTPGPGTGFSGPGSPETGYIDKIRFFRICEVFSPEARSGSTGEKKTRITGPAK
uniref:Alpha-(1,6)-fucosyltransferase N- and catalytic domain-containing protein n=1 Tax=Meloidogyne enterolobii TaxID=390850 RepID=A0A6V7YCD3_MELEN|nr:unnamed protein product [Meloidogyne enterolobii]